MECLRRVAMSFLVGISTAHTLFAQSALDGVSFDASIYNLPDSIGVVRLADAPNSDCRSPDSTPVGNDVAENCLTVDSGGSPVTMTFNAGPQTIGGLTVTPTVISYSGGDPIDVVNNEAPDNSGTLTTWTNPGDLIEFTMRTTNNTYPANDEADYFGFSATGIQYPNAVPDSEVGFLYDEELGVNPNFYLWFEDEDGPITNYDIFLPTGIAVGTHPVEDRDVVYILFSQGQVDEITDTLAGGSLDYYSHGSTLSPDPNVGNLLTLADGSGIDGLTITGWGLGTLIQPPEMLVVAGVPGDFDGDDVLTAADIDLLSAQVGLSDLSFDVNGDGAVTADDRTFWIDELANSISGDANLDGQVQFPDFLALSANFGQAGGWAAGDFDGSGDVQFPDFLQLSANFGQAASAAAVPEPNAFLLFAMSVIPIALLRQRRRIHSCPTEL